MIRAALLVEWPGLSHIFGLMPWDVGRLSPAELSEYRRQAQDFAERMTNG